MGDDKVIGAKIARGEIEVDQPGDAVAKHQDVVGEEVGMNDVGGQIARPVRAQMSKLVIDDRLERSEEHTSELQSLMRISYAVFCLKKKKPNKHSSIFVFYEYNGQRTPHLYSSYIYCS